MNLETNTSSELDFANVEYFDFVPNQPGCLKPVSSIQPRGEVSISWVLSLLSMIIIIVCTIWGNLSVAVGLVRSRRAPAHYPLASLAAADLLVGVTVLPLAAARDMFSFDLPWTICTCWSTLDVLCCTASILSICALGWERWCGITAPLARAHRNRRAKISAALVWPVSTMIALPTAFIPSQKQFLPDEVPKACSVNTDVTYVFCSTTCSFYIPASIMIFFYVTILRSLAIRPPIRAHHGRSPGAGKILGGEQPPCETNCPPTPLPTRVENQNQDPNIYSTPKRSRLRLPIPLSILNSIPSPLKTNDSPGGLIPRQRRATRTIVMLMSLFLICWTPFFIMLPIDSLCDCVSDNAWKWCTWLGYANSALNPMVYAAVSPSVRRALRNSITFTTSSVQTCTTMPMTPSVHRA